MAEIRMMRTTIRYDRENAQWVADFFLEEDEECCGGALTTVNGMNKFLR